MSPLNPWTTVPGAEALQEIYGYWPNLHDAVLRELRLNFTDSSAMALLDYERVHLKSGDAATVLTFGTAV